MQAMAVRGIPHDARHLARLCQACAQGPQERPRYPCKARCLTARLGLPLGVPRRPSEGLPAQCVKICENCVKIGVKIGVRFVPEGPKRHPNGLRENSEHVVKKVSKVHFAWENDAFEKFSQVVPNFHAKSHTIFHDPDLDANLKFHGVCA